MLDEPMLEAVLFYGFAAMALAGAFGVLLSRNIVRTAVWLLATLAAAAGIYFLLAAPFVGAIQLIIYTGGTLVLIIFGVMLTAKNPYMRFAARPAELAAAAVVCLLLAGLLIRVYLGTTWHSNRIVDHDWARVATQPDAAAAIDRLTDLHADGTANIGTQLLSTYLVPFEVISLLLLAVLIGASYLARPRVPTSPKVPGGGSPSPLKGEGRGAGDTAADKRGAP